MILNCIYLIIIDVEHLFICSFFNWTIVFYLLMSYKSSICIMNVNLLSNTCFEKVIDKIPFYGGKKPTHTQQYVFWNIFSHSIVWIFTLLIFPLLCGRFLVCASSTCYSYFYCLGFSCHIQEVIIKTNVMNSILYFFLPVL